MKSLYTLALFVAVAMAHESESSGEDVESSLSLSLPAMVANAISSDLTEVKAAPEQNVNNVQVTSNLAYHRCVTPGHVTSIFEGIDVNYTPTLTKSIKKQLEVAFFVPSNLLNDVTVVANAQAVLRNNHTVGLRFNPAYDSALSTLTEEKVNAELAIAEVQFKKALGRNLQYVMFAHGTDPKLTAVAEKRSIRVVQHNIDFSSADTNVHAVLHANFVNPALQSFVTLQNSHNPKQWDTLRDTHNAAVGLNFTPVRLSTCIPPLRPADADPQALVDVNPKTPANNNPQPINNNTSNMAAGVSVQSALIGCAVALAVLVLA